MSEPWTVGTGEEAFEARGFKSQSKGFNHVEKHFLKTRERWGQLCSEAEIERFQGELTAAAKAFGQISAESNGVRERALARYLGLVRLESRDKKALRIRDFLYQPREGAQPHRNIGAVCEVGLIAILRKKRLSELDTAYRPAITGSRAPKTRSEFVNAAFNKLAQLVSDSEDLEKLDMTTSLEIFAENVQRMLVASPATDGDIVNLAVAGENLRRGLVHEADDSPHRGALGNYDAFLASFAAAWPDPKSDLGAAVDGLRSYSTPAIAMRDQELGRNLLLDVDAALSTAAGGTRAGALPVQTLDGLADQARDALAEMAPKLLELSAFAERRRSRFGLDPDYPNAFAFYGGVGQFSPARVEVADALATSARYAKLVERAAAKLGSTSALDWISNAIAAAADWFEVGLEPALVGSMSDDDLGQVETVEAFGGLEVLRDRRHLHFVVPSGCSLGAVAVRASDGQELEAEVYEAGDGARVVAPAEDAELSVLLTIDGELVELPLLRVKRDES